MCNVTNWATTANDTYRQVKPNHRHSNHRHIDTIKHRLLILPVVDFPSPSMLQWSYPQGPHYMTIMKPPLKLPPNMAADSLR